MTPEELALTRVLWAQNRGRTIQFIEDDKMSRAAFELQNRVPMLLDHIDTQAAQISDLKRQIITLSDSVVSVESRKDRQIEAMKEKLVEERATRLHETTKALPGKFPDSPLGWTDKAHEQLKTEMPEVGWG